MKNKKIFFLLIVLHISLSAALDNTIQSTNKAELDENGCIKVHRIMRATKNTNESQERALCKLQKLYFEQGSVKALTKHGYYWPLHLAIRASLMRVAHFFIKRLPDLKSVINEKDEYGYALLHYAAFVQDIAMPERKRLVRKLLDAKADPCIVSDYERYSPLYMAAERGYFDIVKMLVNAKANINYQNPNSKSFEWNEIKDFGIKMVEKPQTPKTPDPESFSVTRALFDWSTDDANVLTIQCSRASLLKRIYKYRFEASGISVSENPYNGRTALHAAAANNYGNIVRFLQQHGADSTIKDSDKKTAAMLSCSYI